jgi:hypothetical protein
MNRSYPPIPERTAEYSRPGRDLLPLEISVLIANASWTTVPKSVPNGKLPEATMTLQRLVDGPESYGKSYAVYRRK